ncbi:MAG TPA: universal stress protein [Burkholderiales bacterium]|nr:universal stress protein [Burkholderiales bacterium]
MKILLAVDGSKPSLDAVDLLIQHAGQYRAKPEVELVTIHLPVPRMRAVGKDQLAQYYEEEGQANLAAAKKKLDAAGIAYKASVLVGPIAETIVKQATQSKCDLICMGSRGMGELGKALLGSTATKVLHLAAQPLLIVK